MKRFPSVLRHCWLGDRKGIRPVKIGVRLLVVTTWNLACLAAPVVTTTSILDYIGAKDDGDILVQADPV